MKAKVYTITRTTKTIEDFDLGARVSGDNGFAVVDECPHGTKFYAFVSWEKPEDWDSFDFVLDDDENKLECCE